MDDLCLHQNMPGYQGDLIFDSESLRKFVKIGTFKIAFICPWKSFRGAKMKAISVVLWDPHLPLSRPQVLQVQCWLLDGAISLSQTSRLPHRPLGFTIQQGIHVKGIWAESRAKINFPTFRPFPFARPSPAWFDFFFFFWLLLYLFALVFSAKEHVA